MKKRFVVAIDSMDAELDSKLLKYVEDNRFGWWHWIDNVWLLVTYDASVSCASIRNGLGNITKNNKIVLEVSDSNAWAGFGPTGEKNNMFEWFHNTWSKD